MPGLARSALLATAVVLVVALSACGEEDSDAKNAYVKQVNAAQAQFASAAKTVNQGITRTSSARQDRRALARFVSTIDNLVGSLGGIKAPGEARTEHGRLVAAIEDHGDEVSRIIARLRSPTTAMLADVHRQLSAAAVTANANLASAIDAINAKLRAE